jgi:hypothetical protein
MRPLPKSTTRGFSLTELLLALITGLIVTAGAVQLYSSGMDATWVVQQRTEMQQDLRAAEGMLLQDISLAGAGLTGIVGQNVPLPVSKGAPIYACSAGPVCPIGSITYPCIDGTCSTSNPPTLYPIMPGYKRGITPPGGVIPSDVITIVYSDASFALNCYSGSANPITFTGSGNTLVFTAPATTPPCSLPPGLTYPQALNNPINGLQAGDLVLLGPSGTASAIGEVTSVSPSNPSNAPATPCAGTPCVGGSTYTVTFADSDTLNLNQAGAPNDLTQLASASAGVPVTRIFVITYYLANWTDAAGNVTTILYRQVNGHPAVPLVDNIANMQFTYDTYNSDGTLLNATGDGGESTDISPNLIRKVNVAHLTIHSQVYGTGSGYKAKGFQSFDVQTSISTRNMSYNNRY